MLQDSSIITIGIVKSRKIPAYKFIKEFYGIIINR